MTARPIILLFVLAIAGFTGTSLARAGSELQQPSVWNFPRVNEMYFKTPWGKLEEYDAGWNIYPADKVRDVHHAGWNYSLVGFADGPIAFFGINCRNVTPESSGKFTNYHNRRPGFQLYP